MWAAFFIVGQSEREPMMMATSTACAEAGVETGVVCGETSLMTLPAREKEARDHSFARVHVKNIPQSKAI